MTVQNEDYRMDYNGDGVQTAFPVTFYFLQDTDLKVILIANDGTETTLILFTQYTVAGAGNPSGGTVTLNTPPAADEKLAILRDMELTQLTDYVENDNFPAESHETALDKLTMIVQQQNEQLDRSITVSEGTAIQVSLPPPDAKKGLKWNDAGDNLDNSTYDLDTQQAAAEAAATSAQASANQAAIHENGANLAEIKANLWANEEEDVEVEPGEYSAKHWAIKSSQGVTGHKHVDNVNGNPTIDDTAFFAGSAIGTISWESVGPTGSGADNIWAAMDALPDGIDWIEIRAFTGVSNTAFGNQTTRYDYNLYARKTGSSEAESEANNITQVSGYNNPNNNCAVVTVACVKVPVDTSKRFDLKSVDKEFENNGCNLYLTGWGINSQ